METTAKYRLVIADDHPLFRDALRGAMGSVLTNCTVGEVGSFDALTKYLAEQTEVDLILLDLAMPGISGFSGLSISSSACMIPSASAWSVPGLIGYQSASISSAVAV